MIQNAGISGHPDNLEDGTFPKINLFATIVISHQ
jgi:hypothetical protein